MGRPVVHVLLATYNGEQFLRPQWASLEAQEEVDVVVHVADDGSTDATPGLLRELAAASSGAVRGVRWLDAPRRGSAARSFLALVEHAVRSEPQAQWFAYADQDDVWLPGKLAAAVTALAKAENGERPALYGGRSLTVDAEDRDLGPSPLFPHPPTFRNALVQNIMGGNTMVMNRGAAQMLAASAQADVIWHDWLTYQLVSAAGGLIHYDARPFLRYRQHGRNVMGSNRRWSARWNRLMFMFRGDFGDWNRRNVDAMRAHAGSFTPDNRQRLEAFRRAREEAMPWTRLAWLRRSGAFRQRPAEHLMLWLACALRRL
jgi:glycosyltransferase involved in cell wall biosynthesis